MGSSIAQRLISVGHEVSVWNRNPAKTKPLVDAGAKLHGSPAALVEACDAVVVMLLNDAASEAVYRGPNGILAAKLRGKLVIDTSTVRPDTMIAIGSAVTQQSAAFVECPVGGSTGPAKEGKLFGLVGGAVFWLANHWSLGTVLRYGNWFLPKTAAKDPLLDEASLTGRSTMFSLGISLAYRIPL